MALEFSASYLHYEVRIFHFGVINDANLNLYVVLAQFSFLICNFFLFDNEV